MNDDEEKTITEISIDAFKSSRNLQRLITFASLVLVVFAFSPRLSVIPNPEKEIATLQDFITEYSDGYARYLATSGRERFTAEFVQEVNNRWSKASAIFHSKDWAVDQDGRLEDAKGYIEEYESLMSENLPFHKYATDSNRKRIYPFDNAKDFDKYFRFLRETLDLSSGSQIFEQKKARDSDSINRVLLKGGSICYFVPDYDKLIEWLGKNLGAISGHIGDEVKLDLSKEDELATLKQKMQIALTSALESDVHQSIQKWPATIPLKYQNNELLLDGFVVVEMGKNKEYPSNLAPFRQRIGDLTTTEAESWFRERFDKQSTLSFLGISFDGSQLPILAPIALIYLLARLGLSFEHLSRAHYVFADFSWTPFWREDKYALFALAEITLLPVFATIAITLRVPGNSFWWIAANVLLCLGTLLAGGFAYEKLAKARKEIELE